VLKLHFLAVLAVEAIAGIINTSAGTVKSRLFYARQNLKKQIEKEMHNEK
jgi:DNA-directed RNA polymerase specialized sigma24 family protein